MEEEREMEVAIDEREEEAGNRCLRRINLFCYCCGRFTRAQNKRKITADIVRLYQLYFIPHQVFKNVNWAPSIFCTSCVSRLTQWANGKVESMQFGVPVMWSEPTEHIPEECYVCCNHMSGMTRTARSSHLYKGNKWVQLPLPHSEAVPVPKKPSPSNLSIAPTYEIESVPESQVSEYQPSNVTARCHHEELTQQDFDDIVKDLGLSQRKSIKLSSKLKQKNLLATGALVYAARGRQRDLAKYFKSIENNTFAYCDDIVGLMSKMHQGAYKPEEWRLFIDSSKRSLKAVLLHVNNSKNSVPLALSTNTKETYLSLKKIIEAVKYNDHQWKICADLKVVTLLRGMQTGYTKNMCFMCLWDTRFKGNQYEKHDWPLRGQYTLGRGNVIEVPLVPMNKILLPPLHIKLGVVKNFIKALDPAQNAFRELCRIFPRISAAKIKEGMLNGPDIRRLMKDQAFENALNIDELVAWDSVKVVIENVLGSHRAETWRIYIQEMLTAFERIHVNMSLKIHFLHFHLDKFAEQSPAESDEHGERFHQVTANLEHWYSGKKLNSLLGDICWNLQQNVYDDDD